MIGLLGQYLGVFAMFFSSLFEGLKSNISNIPHVDV